MANPARATTTDYTNLAPAQGRISVALLNASKVQAALNVASDWLDGQLRNQFTLPLVAPYPQDVIEFEVVYAAYRLLMNVGFNPQASSDMALKDDFDRKVAWAVAVGKGEQGINANDSSSDEGPSGPEVITSTSRGYSERGLIPGSPPTPRVGAFSDD